MPNLEDLAASVERLLVRHDELKRSNTQLEAQLAEIGSERDSLKSRLAAARSRIDALLDRLPADSAASTPGSIPSGATAGEGST